MSASLDKNVAIIDGVTGGENMIVDSDYISFPAIAEECIPPHTINDIRIGVKIVNAGARVYAAEALARRGLMLAGGSLMIEGDEDEVFELTIPVMNLTNENVNIAVGDEVAVICFSATDNLYTLSQADWDVYNGGEVYETLTITVTDGTDPIVGASISIDWGTAVTTNDDGEAEFSGVTANTHHILISKTWYDSFDDDVEIDDEEIELHLAVHENDGGR